VDRITELLAIGLANLSAEELDELSQLIVAETDRIEALEATTESVAELTQLADAAESVQTEVTRRADEQAALQEQRDAALARLRPAAPAVPDDEAEVEEEAAPEPVSASGRPAPRRPALSRMAPGRAPGRSPSSAPRMRAQVVNGAEVTSRDDVVQAFSHEIQRSRGVRGRGVSRVSVITASTEFPNDRMLRRGDGATNETLIAQALAPEALVAAGGLCAPIENLYDVTVSGSVARPVRDALPMFGADRGGVSLRPGPVFSDWAAGVSDWTLADDVAAATPGGDDPTKDIIEAACSAFEDFTVEATVARVRFRNVTSRFDPEMTAANLQALDIAYARHAENKLLTQLAAQCLTVTSATEISGTRDVLRTIDRLRAAYRSVHRVSPLTLQMTAPEWLRDMIRADLTAGDNNPTTLAAADAYIDGLFTDRGIRPIWHLDGRAAAVVGPPAIAAQQYAAFVEGAALAGFPSTAELMFWQPGDFLYLDSGALDLGVVRDSSLNEVNAYETFKEEFNGLAFRGTEAIRVIVGVDDGGELPCCVDSRA
jgi:hypothetical protein